MNANDVYPTNYLKAEDIPTPMTVTIEGVGMETMHDKSGKEMEKPVVSFSELPKGLVCNKTNWKMLTKLFGDETDAWKDKRITMVIVPVDAFGETVDAIRLTPVKPAGPKKTEQQILKEMGIQSEEPADLEPPTIEPQTPA